MNRQCSIGYHWECSDPLGYECDCRCHENWIEFLILHLEATHGCEHTDDVRKVFGMERENNE